MSRRTRNRVTATVLGGLLLGAALLTTGTASAAQADRHGRQVVFAGGGVLGFSCRSTPSIESLTVPTEGVVRLVNRTGRGARLLLDGESRGSIPDDGATEVAFRSGTTAVTLDPDCPLSDQAEPVLVTATPRMTVRPDPIPAPVDPGEFPDTAPTGPDVPDATDDPGPALPGPDAVTTRPQRPPATVAPRPAPVRPSVSRAVAVATRAATRAAQVRPRRGPVPRVKVKNPVRGTARAATPAFSGRPPGDDRAVLPGVPTLDLPPMTVEPAPVPSSTAPTGVVAAQPVGALRPMPDSQPLGLLTLIAGVSVLGVSIALIRAFVSQRASRSTVA